MRVRNRPACVALDPAPEDQLHLLGAAEIEVLADHLLEEQASCCGLLSSIWLSENSACRVERS
jgi:hypothetical protein